MRLWALFCLGLCLNAFCQLGSQLPHARSSIAECHYKRIHWISERLELSSGLIHLSCILLHSGQLTINQPDRAEKQLPCMDRAHNTSQSQLCLRVCQFNTILSLEQDDLQLLLLAT